MPISGTLIRGAASIAVSRISKWRAEAAPRVIVAIPARDEAERIGHCLESLARQQDWPGHFQCARDLGIVLLVNNSSDRTFEAAEAVLRACDLPFLCRRPASRGARPRWRGAQSRDGRGSRLAGESGHRERWPYPHH